MLEEPAPITWGTVSKQGREMKVSYSDELGAQKTRRSLDILFSLSEASNEVFEDLGGSGKIHISFGSTTVTIARTEGGEARAKGVVTIDRGSTEANEAAGNALQDSGKYSCSSEQDGTVRCEKN